MKLHVVLNLKVTLVIGPSVLEGQSPRGPTA